MKKAFGEGVDFGQVVKIYRPSPIPGKYAPPICIGTVKTNVTGRPERTHISTSHVERLNLTLRMKNRRFTRLTNAFSKKVSNHCLSVAIYFMHYHFCRIHQTLRVTPAMAADYSNHVWELAEVIALLDKNTAQCAA